MHGRQTDNEKNSTSLSRFSMSSKITFDWNSEAGTALVSEGCMFLYDVLYTTKGSWTFHSISHRFTLIFTTATSYTKQTNKR